MKKVVCINDKEFNKDRSLIVPVPKVGDEFTVIDEYLDEWDNNDPVYVFAEYGRNHIFSQRYFAEISDLDETTMVNEEWEEKNCVPVNQKS